MKVTRLDIPGLLILEPQRFGDDRGWFVETWQRQRYLDAGIEDVVQDNLVRSNKGVLRGLHAQEPHAQGKLVQVYAGRVFDVAVDLRRGSPTFGQWHGIILSADDLRQFYIPPGFAHGYYVLTDDTLFAYTCTDTYHPEAEFALYWKDPQVGIDWPLDGAPRLSDKDRNAPRLKEIPSERLSRFRD